MSSLRLQELATNAPPEVLTCIMTLAGKKHVRGLDPALDPWRTTSNSALLPLALVCRSRRAPAQDVLFRSPRLNTPERVDAFLHAVQARPDLASRTTALMLGCGNDYEELNGVRDHPRWGARGKPVDPGSDTEATSTAMIAALALCTNLQKLNLTKIHPSTLPAFLSTFANLSISELQWRYPRVELPSPGVEDALVSLFTHPSLRILVLDSVKQIKVASPPPLPLSTLTMLILRIQHTSFALELVTLAGPTLQSVEMHLVESVPYDIPKAAGATTTSPSASSPSLATTHNSSPRTFLDFSTSSRSSRSSKPSKSTAT